MLLHQPKLSGGGNVLRTSIRHSDSWDFHFHKNFEVIHVLRGEVECTLNGRTETLCAGEYSMCLSNEIHSGHSIGDALFWVCVFSEDIVHSFSKAVAGKVGDGFVFTCREEVQKYLESVFLNTDEQDIMTAKSCLYALCGEYLRCVTLAEKDKTKAEAMSIIVDFVSKNYMRNIGLSDIARLLNYDYHYVSRLFRGLFNMPFCDFLKIYRLENATRLLEEGGKKNLDIAFECGFQSVRSFNHAFKEYYRITPSEYRRGKNNFSIEEK